MTVPQAPVAVVNLMVDTHAASGSAVRPVSIGGLQALAELRERVVSAGHEWLTPEQVRASSRHRDLIVLWDFGSVTRLPRWLLQRDPDRRYPDALSVAAALQA